MSKEPVILALVCWFALVGLTYLIGALVVITFKAIKPIIVEISDRNIREKIVKDGLFCKQTKILRSC